MMRQGWFFQSVQLLGADAEARAFDIQADFAFMHTTHFVGVHRV